jgi:Chalcone isomerase-like
MTKSFTRRAALSLFASLAALPAWAARPITTEGITFTGDMTLADSALQLNGVGLRAVAWLKGYAAGLYLPRKAATTPQVLAQTGPKRLRMVMLQDVDAEEFVKAFHKGVARNAPAADQPKLTDRMVRFDTVVRSLGKLKKRDTIDLDSLPGRGLQLTFNGKPRGEPIEGDDLYAALLLCFIGEKPTDNALKAGLLGAPLP